MKKVQLITMILFVMLAELSYAGCSPFEIVNVSPSVGSNNVSINTSLSFTPNNMIGCNVSTKFRDGYLKIYNSQTNNIVDSININNFYPYGYEALPSEVLTFNLNTTLEYCTSYYVTLTNQSLYNPCCSNGGEFLSSYGFGQWISPNWVGFTWEFTTEGIISSITSQNVSCNLSCDGSAVANVQGGSGNYSFSWNDNQNQTTQTADNLCSGSYIVLIIDNVYGCTTNSNINISQPDQINIVYQSIPSTNGDGQIDINVSGGVPPYSYSWTNTSGFNSNSEDLQNLYAGTYTLVVTDANGCQESVDITVSGVAGLNASELTKFSYSPNPCNDYLNISLNGEYNINVYDMYGKVVLNTFFVNNKTLDVTSLDNGSYIIHLYNNEINLKRNIIKQ